MSLKESVELLTSIFSENLKLIPKTSVSIWADNYRMLPSTSAEPGRWYTDRAPYQREIMDAFTEKGIDTVVVKSASQIGKSDIMNNVIGRFAHLDPCAIMMMQPTLSDAEDFSKSRISPMIEVTPVLKSIFREVKSRSAGNTILTKYFTGGRLVITGANSPSSLASKPIKLLMCDEVDRFPDSAGSEGDPVDLASKRMTTFWDRRKGLFSTPTIKNMSRIDDEYLTGTQEEWQHRCPNCQEWHLVTHRDIHTEHIENMDSKGRKHVRVLKVEWRCPDCGFSFGEERMKRAAQRYIPQNPEAKEKGIRSFFVNCWASPWINWEDVMQEWLEAKGDSEREKVVVNTRFGESYEQSGAYEDGNEFLKRREEYGAELPEGVLILTAAVDVQDNRLEYEICGWGENEECWGIKKDIILGSPDTPQPWAILDEQLDREYKFKNGTGLVVARTFIDSGGHYTKEAYNYSFRHLAKQRFVIKGSSLSGVPIIHKYSKVKVMKNYTIPLVLIGVSSGKQYVMDRLAIASPGPRYFHFPLDVKDDSKGNAQDIVHSRGYDDIYFKGLVSERLVSRRKNGRMVLQWETVSKDIRNEPLDLRVYNLACVKSLNPNFEALKELITGQKAANIDSKSTKTTKKRLGGRIKRGLKEDI